MRAQREIVATIVFTSLVVFLTVPAWGKRTPKSVQSDVNSPFVVADPSQERNIWWSPLLSAVLPGFDQWWEGQYGYGAIYSGAAVAGFNLIRLSAQIPHQHDLYGNSVSAIGGNLFQNAAGLSAWHSFQTAVRTRHSEFSYLTEKETPLDLVLAPIRFEYVVQPEIAIVLIVSASFAFIYIPIHYNVGLVSPVDREIAAFFTAHRAGVSEEAFFRGWLMPAFTHLTNSPGWGNAISAALFGAIHGFSTGFPIPQFLAGLWLGYIVQKNNWKLAPSIFTHFWYDLFLFIADVVFTPSEKQGNSVWWLPTLSFAF